MELSLLPYSLVDECAAEGLWISLSPNFDKLLFFVISMDLHKSAFGENRGWGKENTEKREEGGIVCSYQQKDVKVCNEQ